jgi:hypothetical protein
MGDLFALCHIHPQVTTVLSVSLLFPARFNFTSYVTCFPREAAGHPRKASNLHQAASFLNLANHKTSRDVETAA